MKPRIKHTGRSKKDGNHSLLERWNGVPSRLKREEIRKLEIKKEVDS